MPIHRIPRATMHEDLHSVERDGEQVVSVAADGPEFVLVGTITVGHAIEYRSQTVSERAALRKTLTGGAA